MHQVSGSVRTSLAVGFPDGALPQNLQQYVGRAHRAISVANSFPYEDAQFEIVMMAPEAVCAKAVREAHRVLRPDGSLLFTVPEKTRKQDGFTLPEIYKIVREGFNIVGLDRPPWWLFGCRGRTISICAKKKNWRAHTNVYRPYS